MLALKECHVTATWTLLFYTVVKIGPLKQETRYYYYYYRRRYY
jgi:hypothetical protein